MVQSGLYVWQLGSGAHVHSHCDFLPGPSRGFEPAGLGGGMGVTGKGKKSRLSGEMGLSLEVMGKAEMLSALQ